jgi:hypothetical protein
MGPGMNEGARERMARRRKERKMAQQEEEYRRLIEARMMEEEEEEEKKRQFPAIPETKALLTKIDEDVYLSF